MFDDSLKNNITLFQEYPSDKIEKAIEESGLEDLVKSLPNGIDTKVNENGNNFSGGEQQRISIARSFIKNTSVILLDEATSNLDTKTSCKIENILHNDSELTAIVVTHKLDEQVLKNYDCIIALKHGRVEEIGTFDELILRKDYFYSLYTINK